MDVVSVIIPCYNQGIYIEECIESVVNQTYKNIEIVIINDGSNDGVTIDKLREIHKIYPEIKVINTENYGLATARNNGIRNSSGKYVVPLDADDKIDITFVEKCINTLENNSDIGVVYTITRQFGTKNEVFNLLEFSEVTMLRSNCVVCTAMYRRSDYDKTVGYNKNMIYGLEDWDFWLSMIEIGVKFLKIDEELFFYRRKEDSMIGKLVGENHIRMLAQIYNNHISLYQKHNISINDYIYYLFGIR